MKICKILDESGRRCGQEYKNVGFKITNFAQNCRSHPKHIQKKQKEVTLNWMLLTN